MFAIQFTSHVDEYPYDDPSAAARPGTLCLGTEREDFLANLSRWTAEHYEAHWKEELRSLVAGRSKAALIVSYDPPENSYNLEIWRAYREGEVVHFQNQLLFYDQLPSPFEERRLSDLIPDRVTKTEEGELISEWDVPIGDVISFLNSQQEKQIVYVRLIDEGTDVSRPVEAVHLELDNYRLLATYDDDPQAETWEFPPGAQVRAELRYSANGAYLLAVARSDAHSGVKS